MLFSILASLSVASIASGSVLRRAPLDLPKSPSNPPDPGMQDIPSSGKADNTFSNGAKQLVGLPEDSKETPPAVYGAREIDLPFSRLFHGNMKFFSKGQYNTPDGIRDQWAPEGQDSATQSACGIPDNAWSLSKVAIHPYFLKYADLSRYCMQDVCISFWKEDGSSDMMLKVTDICSTDPSDPTYCETPNDIKIDRAKAQIMTKNTGTPLESQPDLMGDKYPEKIWWFFCKCWADGLPQPAYMGNNWFTEPALPNNLEWSQTTSYQQWLNNKATYEAKGWQTYPNGAYNTQRDETTAPAISDWAPGDPTPAWQPIAGGKGFGMPNSSGPAAGGASRASSNSSASTGGSSPASGSSSSPAFGSSSSPASGSSSSPASGSSSSPGSGSSPASGSGSSPASGSGASSSGSDSSPASGSSSGSDSAPASGSGASSSGSESPPASGSGASPASSSGASSSGSDSSPASRSSSSPGSGSSSSGSDSSPASGSAHTPDSGPGASSGSSSSPSSGSGSGSSSGSDSGAGSSGSGSGSGSSSPASGSASTPGSGSGSGSGSSSDSSSPSSNSTSSMPATGSGAQVALWEPCNFPSKGVNGPLPCVSGAECICKDSSYAQCRKELDGKWTPPGEGTSWQCQKPGDVATGSIAGGAGGQQAGAATGTGAAAGGDDEVCDDEE